MATEYNAWLLDSTHAGGNPREFQRNLWPNSHRAKDAPGTTDRLHGPSGSTNEEESEDRFFGGVAYRLPYMVESSLAIDSEGDARVGIGKEIQLTPRLSVFGDLEYDTRTQWEYTTGASFLLNKQFSLTAGYHSDHGWGAGIGFRF